MINKQKGNMYEWVTHTWNPISGKCKHNCIYCYMKRFPQKELHLNEKELKTNLGEGNFIFVGSGTDIFAEDVSNEWILKVMNHCMQNKKNTYLFQTKNPERIADFFSVFPDTKKTIIGTTLETNRISCPSDAPIPADRAKSLASYGGFRKMVTIEPIIDFDLFPFVQMIKDIEPEFVNIGADSNKKKDYILPEPSKEKIEELIVELKKFTKVNIKDNLKRLGLFSTRNET